MFEEKLLAIEDDVHIAAMIAQVALEAGFDSNTVSNSTEIRTACIRLQPHVIVLDILMPGLDGFEVLHFLAEQKIKAQVVLLSGSHQYRQMAEKMAAVLGITIAANLGKPFRVAELRLVLQEIRLEWRADKHTRQSSA